MQLMAGGWKTALIDIDRTTEFTGDDVDQYSELVDLGSSFSHVLVKIPTITSATVTIAICKEGSLAKAKEEVPDSLYILDRNATGHFLSATTAGTTGGYIIFNVGAAQFIRIKCGANQAADRTFYVRGC